MACGWGLLAKIIQKSFLIHPKSEMFHISTRQIALSKHSPILLTLEKELLTSATHQRSPQPHLYGALGFARRSQHDFQPQH
ncbi:uncharacterized protein G2W53_032645 [Senna tora]|uniref:Uncharacterized protein n=1 Tax=Senna tora TaxID=362788 RepID=A0A834WC04_9FABA|nr:uncharacterized protein G2W53_032645 [Senna tora]